MTKDVKTALYLHIQPVKNLSIRPKSLPSDTQKATILGKCVKIAVIEAMSGHAFHLNGTTYVQDDGSAMGNELTVAIARSVMLKWNQHFKHVYT
jgi:hypothetical protein